MADDFRDVERMKAAVGTSAELKLRLINLRSQLANALIFVFEGDDDRAVYGAWMRQIDRGMVYEPFTCKGKSAVLRLKVSVDRDAAGLGDGVFFFVDHDFDGSRGVELNRNLYVTDGYSMENDLINWMAIEETLKVELNCHSSPGARAALRNLFDAAYDSYLRASSDINFLIFAVRKLGVGTEGALPNSVGRCVDISIDGAVRNFSVDAATVVRPVREISEFELTALADDFLRLEPRARYRGKFSFSFLINWLSIVASERRSEESHIFAGMDMEARTRVDRVTLATLAARSLPPGSLDRFVRENVVLDPCSRIAC
ncbi:TPA: DUF4435 domain-containing protein [Stenotrophomonas maltophilia]|uniref:DUF4435 domain-containing protein n=1 Tax=Stenotrophomonas maltophilia TaxID=40324 RepID=UPI0013045E4F|nr:DUF4435 domain-containing protein [Stenotrophomonas maltophilia]EKT4106233.1 DUF4435 domain-containing protein [Stenotrophomonas maltophilia]MBN5074318.1 DUF4435 domain-containing protein [Stenotrophomonas maltophilia]QNG95807.1 hypothetical protein AEPCKKLL_02560 [Stenotrophomonas maltophilia]WDW02874.1 DUF4435 domain-containing protein [Stenotrophomonas maltophilia]HDS1088696.1 DUF4435 domain-containing protein [Stenotrophomonas maltophilia]